MADVKEGTGTSCVRVHHDGDVCGKSTWFQEICSLAQGECDRPKEAITAVFLAVLTTPAKTEAELVFIACLLTMHGEKSGFRVLAVSGQVGNQDYEVRCAATISREGRKAFFIRTLPFSL